MSLEIRPARAGDGVALHAMVAALAEDHELVQHLKATPQDLENALFHSNGMSGAMVAFWDGAPAGCTIWHKSFSTFRGKPVIYLEDLSVLPPFRRRGIAKALMKAMARMALDGGYRSIYWVMMQWNDQARALYASLGAEIDEDVCFCRLRDEELEKAAS